MLTCIKIVILVNLKADRFCLYYFFNAISFFNFSFYFSLILFILSPFFVSCLIANLNVICSLFLLHLHLSLSLSIFLFVSFSSFFLCHSCFSFTFSYLSANLYCFYLDSSSTFPTFSLSYFILFIFPSSFFFFTFHFSFSVISFLLLLHFHLFFFTY